MAQKTLNTLPSVQTLFSDSWKTFKGSVLNLFILYLVTFGIIAGLGIIGIIASLPLGVVTIISGMSAGKLTPAIISSFWTLGFLLLVFIIMFTIMGYAIHAASILFVGKYATKPAFGKTFKSGFRFILSLFLVGLLSGFVIAGGYFLFVIPGIFFAILFSFAPYEIVLNNQGVLAAMRRSSRIVLSNFWGILTRLILWVIVVMVVAFLPGILSGRNTAAGAGLSGLSFFVNIALGWFGICYSVTLYKQACRGLETDKGTKLLWPVLVGIVGWVVGIIMIIALTSVIILVIANIAKTNAKPKPYQMYQGQQNPSYAPWQPSTPSAR